MVIARTIPAYRRNSTVSPILARHRAFIRGLCSFRRNVGRLRAVAQVLRRLCDFRVQQALVTMQFGWHSSKGIARVQTLIRSLLRETVVRIAPRSETLRILERQSSFATRVIEHRNVSTVPNPAMQATSVVPRADRRASVPRLAFTVLRPAPVAAPPSTTAVKVEQVTAMARPQAARHSERNIEKAPLTLPPQELSRVTQYVIHELDRRVVSYRERMGIV